MKYKLKPISTALLIAIILTVIFAASFYYIGCKNMSEAINELEDAESATGSASPLGKTLEKQLYQDVLFGTIISSIFLFCMSTLVSYIVVERLRKHKK
jgi:amino acid transporter